MPASRMSTCWPRWHSVRTREITAVARNLTPCELVVGLHPRPETALNFPKPSCGAAKIHHMRSPLSCVQDAMDWADAANCETFGEEAGWDVAEAQLQATCS